MTITKEHTRRSLLSGAAAIAAAASLPLPAIAQTPLTIRLGFASVGIDNRQFAGGSAAAIAHANGYLEDEFKNDPGVKLAWFFFKGAGPAVNEAFATGQLDFAIQGDLPQVIGRAAGLKTKQLMANGAHAPLYLAVPPDSPIKTVKDVKGRKISLFRGTNNHLAAVKVLAANGLTERDVQFINMDTAATNAALAAKEIDGAFGNFDLLLLASQGLAKIPYTTKGDNRSFERQGTIIGLEDFVTGHPDLTGRIIKALVKAAQWSSQEEHRDEAFEIWAKSGRPASIYRDDFADQTLKYRNSPLLDPFFIEQYRVQARQAKEYGLIRRDITVDDWFAPQFLEAALKDLQLEKYWPRLGADGKPLDGAS
ncbi:MAG: ABC transporter substrate-binding protein [Alphaproteobacteria bacterium]|nr:ABC transporter substrate-binding protein [Alphaproteobacteria bacterium]